MAPLEKPASAATRVSAFGRHQQFARRVLRSEQPLGQSAEIFRIVERLMPLQDCLTGLAATHRRGERSLFFSLGH
jgi:hypothetical protein